MSVKRGKERETNASRAHTGPGSRSRHERRSPSLSRALVLVLTPEPLSSPARCSLSSRPLLALGLGPHFVALPSPRVLSLLAAAVVVACRCR